MKTENLQNYKEILFKRTEETHIFYFKYKDLKGFYVLDGDNKKWLTCDLIKFQQESVPTKRFFDIGENEQIQCFMINNNINDKDLQFVIDMILANKRQGTPRRYFVSDTKQKINIEFECE
jgi:hypothetical protein